MEYTKKDFGAYKLHLIKTDKFKTIEVRLAFRSPIKKEEITLRNILIDMFVLSSKKYNFIYMGIYSVFGIDWWFGIFDGES